jgi:hypothetical protein
MAFKDILRKQRQSGSGIASSFGTAASATLRESVDLRNTLFTNQSFLGALFPNVKGFKASSVSPKTKTSLISSGGGATMAPEKLDMIAKNTMSMPVMARDINIMRQNISKLVKATGVKPSTRTDSFFNKALEKEKEYESKFKSPSTPTKVDVSDQGSNKSKNSSSSSGILGLFGDILMVMLPLVAMMGLKYFTDPEFKIKVNEMVHENIVKPISNSLSEFGSQLLALSAGIATAILAFKSITAGTIIGAISRLALNPYVIAAAVATYMISSGRKEADEMFGIQEKYNKSLSDPNAPKLTPDEQLKMNKWLEDRDRQQKQIDELHAEPSEEPSAAFKLLKNALSFGVGKDDYKLKSNPLPSPAMEAGRGFNRAPTPTDGLSLLNSVMDKEGITDDNIRGRIIKLAQVESSMNPNARGPVLQKGMHKGDQAHGLLQIMPKTAPEVGFTKDDIRDPEKAATAGVRYFLKNLNKFNGNLDAATVAHHSGPGGAQKWMNTGNAGTFDQATGISTNAYLAKVQGQAEMMAASPRISGSAITSASSQLGTTMMASSSAQPVVINAPTNNVNNSSGGGGGGMPSVVDTDFMKYLVGKMA